MADAQEMTYKGRVFDTDGKPLEFANVVALSLPDSVFTVGSITDSNGEFAFSLDDPIDSLLFKVSLIGYRTAYSTPMGIDSIVLQNSATELAEVVVKGGKTAFDKRGNNLVCNVAGTALYSESNINDILGKLPGFYTQGDQLKSINQGEVKYFLNNRPVAADYISHIDVRTIQSIEIDRHPRSRYSGEVGTVVIVHTNTMIEGISAFLRSYTRVNHRLSPGVDGEVRYRYKGFNFTLGADYTIYQSKPSQENSFELIQALTPWSVKSQDTKKTNRTTSQTYFANLEYNFSDKHQISLRYTREPSRYNSDLIGDLSVRNGDEYFSEEFENSTVDRSVSDNINFYYKGILSKNWTVDVSSDWYQQRTDSQQDLQEEQRLAKIYAGGKSALWGFSPRAVYHAQRNNIEIGVDWSKSIIRGWTKLNIDDALPNDNEIQEVKKAGYVSGNWVSPNDLWSIDLGLRFETIQKKYKDNTQDEDFQNFTYSTLLPSFALSYSPGNWKHQFNYHTSILYPSFYQMTSGDVYINRYNLKKSNPNLERSVLHSISYDCSFRWLYLSAGYTYTYYPISETFELEGYNGEYRTIVRPQNLSHMQGLNVIANVAPRFGIYEPRLMLGYIQNFMTLPEGKGFPSRRITKPFLIFALNNSFTFPYQWVVNLDYSYNGAGSNGYIVYSSSSSLNFSIAKHFFDHKLQVSLNLTDLLNSSTPRITGAFQGVRLNSYSWMDSRSARLNIVWYFNKHQSTKTHSSITPEVNRL